MIDRLLELGFIGEMVPAAGVDSVVRWYGLGDVSELSREEANVIAQRVVPAFIQQSGIAVGEFEGVKDIVATALQTCIINHTLEVAAPHGALNDECGRAVEEATRAHLGADRAAAIGEAIERDLASRSAFKE